MSTTSIQVPLFKAYTAKELAYLFEHINEEIQVMNSCLSLDVMPLTKLAHHYAVQLKQLAALDKNPQNGTMIITSRKSVESMVVHLQIHDVIAQKLDHIHQINAGLVQELHLLKNVSQIGGTSYLAVVLELIVMNREQLLLIKEEYHQATGEILENLDTIESKISELALNSVRQQGYFGHQKQFNKVLEDICLNLLSMANTINAHYLTDSERDKKLIQISRLFTMDSERWVLEKVMNGGAERYQAGKVQKKLDVDQTELF